MTLRVWQYWEGPQPEYIGLCLETVRRHEPDAVLLDPQAFAEIWRHDRDLQIDGIGPHYRADFIRVYVCGTTAVSGGRRLRSTAAVARDPRSAA